MAGPWEKYAKTDASSGPWSKYKSSPNPDNDLNQSKVAAVTSGLVNGGTLGFADEASALGSTALNAITGFSGPLAGGSTQDLVDEYRSKRDSMRSENEKIKAANPKTYLAGQLVGGLLTGGSAGSVPNSLKSAVQQGATLGAVGGLGESNADLTRDQYGQAAADTAKGAGFGAGAGAVGYGIGKGLQSLANGSASKGLKDAAEFASARAQGAERGTVKSLGADKVKEIGRYGLDEGVVTPLASTEDMIARNDAIKARGGKMMGEVYKAIDDAGQSSFNPLDTAVKIEDKIGDFWRSPINRGETKQLENTLESVLMRGDKELPLNEAQTLKEELSKVANWKNKVNVTDKEKMARDAYGVVSDEIDRATQSGADKIGSQDLLQKLQNGRRLYSGAKGSETLLENKQAREIGNKLFGITDAAVAGPAIAAAPFTHGASLLAGVPITLAKKGIEKYGNQMFAVGADKISNKLVNAPEAFGKFAPILQAAAQKGGQALAATNLMLQKDPEYLKVINAVAMRGSPSVSTPNVVAPNQSPQTADSEDIQQDRSPSSQLKGEALWMKRGADNLGLSDQQVSELQSTAKGRDLLIQASDLPQNSKRFQMIKDQLGRGNK
jgi:hypothetical protein